MIFFFEFLVLDFLYNANRGNALALNLSAMVIATVVTVVMKRKNYAVFMSAPISRFVAVMVLVCLVQLNAMV